VAALIEVCVVQLRFVIDDDAAKVQRRVLEEVFDQSDEEILPRLGNPVPLDLAAGVMRLLEPANLPRDSFHVLCRAPDTANDHDGLSIVLQMAALVAIDIIDLAHIPFRVPAPAHVAHPFRRMPPTCSEACRPLIPAACRPFL
jgi:hypothetical protein